MSDMDVFTIEDDFDPLADLELVDPEEGQETDYLPPIPDADKSVVPEAVPLTAEERIEKLLAGIPGQQFRILRAVDICFEPKTIEEASAELDAAYPNRVSVYDAAQIIVLLEQAGALERMEEPVEAAPAADDAAEGAAYLTVTPVARVRYRATQAGLDAVAARVGQHVVLSMLAEEPQYLPLYERILTMCAVEGGGATKELDAAIDSDPLCAEPKRFCGYFRGKLETAGALEWRGAWTVTDRGAAAMASGVFAN